ncbi:Anti-sigma regulatory factor (Ser/Thr protein kinase) [Pedococcus cremeus]|uniref:Anti-sigma regulatory factor (Ser/Thr protein kinase) n=1 Tax=Pedococcus cremeus TaxID=587636 RepID=A0A1H9XRN9_9MICO|nr:sensor histidine kinase [Pedococcus cremeus]SES48801.1 Anti-sigma regulatory factor (Ser/Thr protein kinase) [Pedococcus cremeus]
MAGFSTDGLAFSVRVHEVLCWRAGPVWAVSLPELGRASVAGRLSEVEGVARALVGDSDRPPAGMGFDIVFLPDTLTAALGAADTARSETDGRGLDTVRRSLGRRLARDGLAPTDVAAALGVAPERAEERVGAPPGEGRPAGPSPSVRLSPHKARATRPAEPTPHAGYRHEALLYRDDDEFLAGTVPFIEEALALGQPVMVALPEPHLTLVRQELGAAASTVRFVDMGHLGANPARIIPAWREFIDEACRDGQEARGIAEPLWQGRHAAEVAECQLHEALLDLAVEPSQPLWLRCAYDVQRLGSPESEGALHSHQAIVGGTPHSHDAGRPEPPGIGTFNEKLPDPPPSADVLDFGPANLMVVRSRVAEQTSAVGLDPERAADLTLAVWELAVNSTEYGGGPAALRIWREPDALVCEVADPGHIDDYLVGRRTPDPTSLGQRGVWLVNQLCDLVQLRSGTEGTTARIFTWL